MSTPAVTTDRPAWSWIAGMLGLVAQTVVTVWVVVLLVSDAVRYGSRSQAHGGLQGDGFFDGIGAFLLTVLAVVVGVFAVALVVALLLSSRTGGVRLAGFIVGLVLQLPLLFAAFATSDDGVGAGEATVFAGAALVLLATSVPATWRWCRRPKVWPR